jgi:predicted AAA+ superfamily ATPase
MYQRILQLPKTTSKKSVFLLGPRQVGKSTIVKQQLPSATTYNLLDSALYRRLSADPSILRKELTAMSPLPSLVIIDEIQLIPELLNEVHLLIENYKIRFVLTGSSARSLKRKGINLLGGRARILPLHPLVSAELGQDFDLFRAVSNGTIPSIYDDDEPEKNLADYAGTYLREEISAEGLTRNIPLFSHFLEVAALCNGSILNYSKISSDAEIKRTTIIDWFQILRDTLIAYDLPAWTKSKKRKAISSSKFYFFDVGVANHLAGRHPVKPQHPNFGTALEAYIFHELQAAKDYGLISKLSYWRSTSGFEVDFLINETIAVEVKSAKRVNSGDLKGLRAIKEEFEKIDLIVACLIDTPQLIDNVMVLPVVDFLQKLWSGELNVN